MTRAEENYRAAKIRQVLELPSDEGILLFHDGVFYAPVNEDSKDEDKDEDLTFEAPLTAQMVDEVLKIYPFKDEKNRTLAETAIGRLNNWNMGEHRHTPPSEEKKCDCTPNWDGKDGTLRSPFCSIHSPTPPDAWEQRHHECTANLVRIADDMFVKGKEAGQATTLNEVERVVQGAMKESHNEGTYKHDWLYEDILKKIEELRKV